MTVCVTVIVRDMRITCNIGSTSDIYDFSVFLLKFDVYEMFQLIRKIFNKCIILIRSVMNPSIAPAIYLQISLFARIMLRIFRHLFEQ